MLRNLNVIVLVCVQLLLLSAFQDFYVTPFEEKMLVSFAMNKIYLLSSTRAGWTFTNETFDDEADDGDEAAEVSGIRSIIITDYIN